MARRVYGALVAQRIERLCTKEEVMGSSPIEGAIVIQDRVRYCQAPVLDTFDSDSGDFWIRKDF